MFGHTNMSKTLQGYTGFESTSAAKHFDQTIRSLRDGMRVPLSRIERGLVGFLIVDGPRDDELMHEGPAAR